MKKKVTIEITKPINQLNLYGYNTYLDLFTKLFDQVKVPNVILLKPPPCFIAPTRGLNLANRLSSFTARSLLFSFFTVVVLFL